MTRGPDDPSGQLYNMANNLAETNNLYPQHPEIVVRLTALMEHIIRSGGSRNLQ
jgi:hypothetical protein